MRRQFTSIDDRSIMGNPFDHTKWAVRRRSRAWVVLDALGNLIHEAATKAEATRWKDQQILAAAGVTPEAIEAARLEQLNPRPLRPGEVKALGRLLKVDTGRFNFGKKKKRDR